MKRTPIDLSVTEATDLIKDSLNEKGFTLFSDVDHHANATKVDLELAESRTIIFGNPAAGTKLMQKDLAISLALPIRIAVIDNQGQTEVIHHTKEDMTRDFDVEGHPVLDKVEGLFATLISELKK